MFHILEDVLDWLGVHPHIDLGVKWGELGLGLLILAPFVWKTCRMFRTMAATTAAMNQRDADADRAIDRMREKHGDAEAEIEAEKAAAKKPAESKKRD
jgi:hypothetical protein